MSYRFKGLKVIINGTEQIIVPGPLPLSPTNGCYAIDSSDMKLKLYRESAGLWVPVNSIIIKKDNELVLLVAEQINFEGNVTVVDGGNNQCNVNVLADGVGSTFQMVFNKTQSIGNTWLDYYGVANSHNTLGVIPFDCKLTGLTYSNVDSDSEIDLKFYKNLNSSPEYTWEIRNKLWAWKTNLNDIFYGKGDRVDVYGATVSEAKKPNKITVILYFTIINSETGEGGGNS
jgi:hypothetical protein